MSQGGYPCIHYKTSHNSMGGKHIDKENGMKKYYLLFPEAYY
jgi:hypothetical protein